MRKPMHDVTVVGGGAAGMLAAATAAGRGLSVLLLERGDRFGKKLAITGKGRCNVTNDCPPREVIENIPTGGKFLQGAINSFTPRDVMALFESLGVPLKTERGNRVFPISDKAGDIVAALRRYMDKTGVERQCARALEVLTDGGAVTGVRSDRGIHSCGAVILATGGVSYPLTGSTGDGHGMAKKLGHNVTPLRGSLVPLEGDAELCAAMAGLTLKNVRLTVYGGGKKPVFEDFGELLFTHFGISGPLVLSASAHMRKFDSLSYYAQIDLKPALDEEKLDKRILRDFEKFSNRDFSNALGELISRTMIPAVIKRSGIPPDTKVHSVSRAQRLELLRVLKNFRIDITGPRPVEEAIVTSGGVDTREISPKTMESKLVRGLYFAGETIDADAYTGGFNLQIAWSTGYAAGMNV